MATPSDSRPKALVVGTGFGCRVHVPALRTAGFDVAGLVGSDLDRTRRRAEKAGVGAAFTDLDSAIGETSAVAVTIATPPHTHRDLTLAAIARGCHVICEKPMAMNVAEAQEMLDAAESIGVTHLMGNEFRWLPERAIVARAIADGLVGEPRMMTLSAYSALVAGESRQPAWWFDEAAGGGWLGAQGSHIIDQVRSWLGDFASLSAVLPTVADRIAASEDTYVVRFRLANGVDGVLQQSAGAWGPSASMARVAGTKGTVWADGGVVRIADKDGVRELPVPDDLVLPTLADLDEASRRQFEVRPFARLAEVLRAGVDARPADAAVAPPTFVDGVAAMRVIDAIRASARQGGALVTL